MAMLAEKRSRKAKWCLNPMGNFWAKDENKFGQKMLEKMGWSPGTGLGAKGQGSTDLIKISVKNDTLGFGNKNQSDKDLWTKNLVNFDTLLAELNGTSQKEEIKPEAFPSLEEKSKSSRARVHYHKFTRGKDVSQYSSKDLNCILPIQVQKYKEREDNEVPVTTNNMYAYFNTKANNPFKTSPKADVENNLEGNPPNNNETEEILGDVSCKKKKKKKKRKHAGENENDEKSVIKAKEKRHKKVKEMNTQENEDSFVDENALLIEEECIEKKSKKRKRKHRKTESDELP